MDVWMLPLGAVLLLFVGYDAIATTLSLGAAAGPLTSRLAGAWWRLARRVARGPTSLWAVSAGPVVVLLTVGSWLALLWVGWTLVFAADTGAVVSSGTGVPAGGWSRVYFAGFTVFTLGVGDYVPAGQPWEVLTALATVTGLGLTTLAITYLVPIVSAATARRAQANTIAGLGPSPQAIVAAAFQAGGSGPLDHRLGDLATGIMHTAERHLSYPVLHYFHDADRLVDFHVQLFVLDEALSIFQHALDEGGPHPVTVAGVRHAVEQVLRRTAPEPAAPPPPPDLSPLRDAGVPVVADEVFAQRLAALADHRGRLARFTGESLWSADVVARAAGTRSGAREGDAP